MYKVWAYIPVTDVVAEHLLHWAVESKILVKNRWELYNTLTFWSTHADVQKKSKARNNQVVIQVKLEERLLTLLSHTGWWKKAT